MQLTYMLFNAEGQNTGPDTNDGVCSHAVHSRYRVKEHGAGHSVLRPWPRL